MKSSVEWDKLLIRARIDGSVPATVNGERDILQATPRGDALEVTVHSRQPINRASLQIDFDNVATEPESDWHVTATTLYGDALTLKFREVTNR